MARRTSFPLFALKSTGSWRESAACRDTDPELFFPVGPAGPAAADARAAKAYCQRCPVREQCLAYAMGTGQTDGIWGGYDQDERRLMRQRPAVSLPDTAAGWRP